MIKSTLKINALKNGFLLLFLMMGFQAVYAQTTVTSNTQSTHDGFFYSFWNDGKSGSVTMTLGPAGNYTTNWTNINNFTAGKGWAVGKADRVICFEGSYDGGKNGFLAVYGWTKDPLIEYYVAEDHGEWTPPGNTGGVVLEGEYECDGGHYKAYTAWRYDSPSIIGNNDDFQQFWSVRTERRSTGTVTFASHVAAWKSFGMNLGTTWDYQIMESEGYQSSGSSNITVSECKTNDIEVKITAPTTTDEFLAPATVVIKATASTPTGSIARVEFYNGTTKLGEDASSPYEYTWTNVARGGYSITAVAFDSAGEKATSPAVKVNVNIPQAPYGGTAQAIPGVIEFENFDEGGNGNAYYDDSDGTSVTAAPNFRTTEDVDIETCEDTGGGYNLGYTTAGEWLEYTVDVATAGLYDIEIRGASENAAKTIDFAIDGKSIATDVEIPMTGGWQVWETILVKDIQLSAGVQILRVTIGDVNYVNLNKMTFISAGSAPTVTLNLPAGKTEFAAETVIKIDVDASSDNSTISKVELYIDDKLVETDNTAPYSFNWSTTVLGGHDIKVVATDASGISGTKTATVTIVEKPITIHLNKGWNLVGYPHSASASVEDALSSVLSEVTSVKDANGFWSNAVDPSLHSLTELEWAKGYFVKVANDCELSW